MLELYDNICGTIGRTPAVRLDRLVRHFGVQGRLYAKLEYLSPGASKKDRAALAIIEEAEQSGALRAGQPVVELTSGNMGTGLAIVCAIKGYRFIAVMSRGNSPERVRMMRALGGEVVLVDQAEGSAPGRVSGEDLARVEEAAAVLVAELGAFRADQFNNAGNVRAHMITGDELWKQCAGDIDVFLDFAGTAGTFAGCAAALRRHKPSVRCYVVEPESAPFLAGGTLTGSGHRIQGGGYGMELSLFNRADLTGCLTVGDGETVEAARALSRVEGIFGGYSAGANAAAAINLLRGAESGCSVAFLIGDSGMKYLSTDLWEA